jgi:hypothetical protein
MVSVEKSEAVYLFQLNTIAASTMVEVGGVSLVPAGANANHFCNTLALFEGKVVLSRRVEEEGEIWLGVVMICRF